MSASAASPQQYQQPSRKGKKAWRKNVDISEVQEGLRNLKDEETKGGLLSEKPSDELFVIDTTGSEAIKKAYNKKHKPLKADEILAQRSAIPAVSNRKRGDSNVTDGVIEPQTKKHKSDWVSRKEWLRLKQVAKEGDPSRKEDDNVGLYDPWADTGDQEQVQDPQFDFLEKPKEKVAPPTIKRPPISLAANGKPVPSVRTPEAGISYNPSFEDWDRLLAEEGQKAVEAEKKRLEEERQEQEKQRLIAEAKDEDEQAGSDDESAWEGFESEYEQPELNKKRSQRKTKTQRNRANRRKEAERKEKWEAQKKKKERQAEAVKEIAEQIEKRDQERAEQSDSDSSDTGDDRVLRRRPLGKTPPPEKPLELVLPDELQDSLRKLKPEGNLMDDRYRTMVIQGKMESRKPVVPKKPKRTQTEKWSYKDFKVPGM